MMKAPSFTSQVPKPMKSNSAKQFRQKMKLLIFIDTVSIDWCYIDMHNTDITI